MPRSPKKDAAILFDLRDSDRNPKVLEDPRSSGSSLAPPPRNPKGTAKPRREKKASIEKPKSVEDNPDVVDTDQALLNQVETSSEKSVSRVVSNTVSQSGSGQGEVGEEGGEDVLN